MAVARVGSQRAAIQYVVLIRTASALDQKYLIKRPRNGTNGPPQYFKRRPDANGDVRRFTRVASERFVKRAFDSVQQCTEAFRNAARLQAPVLSDATKTPQNHSDCCSGDSRTCAAHRLDDRRIAGVFDAGKRLMPIIGWEPYSAQRMALL